MTNEEYVVADWERVWLNEFTRDRLEQIRQLEEELAVVSVDVSEASAAGCRSAENVYRRILARLSSALAELKRGMLPGSPASSGG